MLCYRLQVIGTESSRITSSQCTNLVVTNITVCIIVVDRCSRGSGIGPFLAPRGRGTLGRGPTHASGRNKGRWLAFIFLIDWCKTLWLLFLN
jgi:hypothetical protein